MSPVSHQPRQNSSASVPPHQISGVPMASTSERCPSAASSLTSWMSTSRTRSAAPASSSRAGWTCRTEASCRPRPNWSIQWLYWYQESMVDQMGVWLPFAAAQFRSYPSAGGEPASPGGDVHHERGQAEPDRQPLAIAAQAACQPVTVSGRPPGAEVPGDGQAGEGQQEPDPAPLGRDTPHRGTAPRPLVATGCQASARPVRADPGRPRPP